MESLSDKIMCSLCQLPLVNTPKVLPGCLHVFCLACLRRLPVGFVTGESDSRSVSGDSDKPESCPEKCLSMSAEKDCIFEKKIAPLSILDGRDKSFGTTTTTNSAPSSIQSSYEQRAPTIAIPNFILSINCPKCDRVSVLPANGFEGLRTSYVTANLAATYKAVEELRSNLPDVECGLCVAATPATSYCSSCRQLICEDHSKCHKRWKKFAVHKVFPVSSLMDRDGRWDGNVLQLLTPPLHMGEVKCSKHSQKENSHFKFFCSTCEDLACLHCTVSAHKDGTDHSCMSITSDVVSEKKTSVVDSLERLNFLVDGLDSLAGDIQTQSEDIVKKTASVKGRIEGLFTEIVDALQSRKLALMDEVDTRFSDPLKKLKNSSKKIDNLRDHILQSRNFIQGNLNSEGDLSLLSMAGVISNHSNETEREYQALLPEAGLKTPEFDFVGDRDDVCDAIASFGSICVSQSLESNPTSHNFPLYERLQKIKSLKLSQMLPLSLDYTTEVFSDHLTDSLTGTYVYHPPVMSSDLASSPVVIDIPKIAGMHLHTLEGVAKPSGIRVDGSFRLVVCEFGTHQVTTFNQNGTEVSRIGKEGDRNGQFLFPQSTACDLEGRMFVVDSLYRIQMFDTNGKFLKSIGTKGKGALQFKDPVAIAISHDQRLFICERENHRIQVLNADLSFLHFIGKPGRNECEFYLPTDISLGKSGYLYVADSGNHRIQILTLDGAFVGSFGKKGSGLGELSQPSHLCVDSSGVFVTEEGNHRVSIFNPNGIFIRTLGEKGSEVGKFHRPLGVAIDRNKTLYVCDSKNRRIQIFK